MEIVHPDIEYVPVKVRKAKLDANGDVVYIDEKRKMPKLIADAISDEHDTSEDEE